MIASRRTVVAGGQLQDGLPVEAFSSVRHGGVTMRKAPGSAQPSAREDPSQQTHIGTPYVRGATLTRASGPPPRARAWGVETLKMAGARLRVGVPRLK